MVYIICNIGCLILIMPKIHIYCKRCQIWGKILKTSPFVCHYQNVIQQTSSAIRLLIWKLLLSTGFFILRIHFHFILHDDVLWLFVFVISIFLVALLLITYLTSLFIFYSLVLSLLFILFISLFSFVYLVVVCVSLSLLALLLFHPLLLILSK